MRNKMRNMGLWITGILLLVGMMRADCPVPCPTVCYYADSTVSGTGSGTIASPWQHLYTVRSQTFSTPGSIICLKRGSAWYGQLAFYGTRAVVAHGASTADGTVSAPFMVDAYGSGAPPTLNAEYPTPTSLWASSCSANICSINTGGFPEGAPARVDMVKFGGALPPAKMYVFQPPTSSSSALTTIYANSDGAVVAIPWSADNVSASLGGWETSSGSASAGYSFTHFDAVINQQLDFGAASVVVILEPISFEPANGYSPNYIFTSTYATAIGSPTGQLATCTSPAYPGAGTITVNTCAQGVDATAYPAAFQAPFATPWQAAVTAALNHMAGASYASKIAYVRVGLSTGGQSNPVAIAGMETLCTPATFAGLKTAWLAYMGTVETAMNAAASGFIFDQGISGGTGTAPNSLPYSFADSMALTAVGNGFGIGGQGLQNSDITAYGNHGNASGGAAIQNYPSSDFVYNWYAAGAGLKESQTVAASNPAYEGIPPGGTMGSLVPLLPFARARGTNSFEIYYSDWRVAYDPGYASYALYGSGYRSVFTATRTGGGGIWGTCEGAAVAIYCPGTGGTAALTGDFQFNYNTTTGVLAIYDDIGSNPVTDYGGIAAVIDGATQILDLDGVNYVSVQHLSLLNQSWYGLEYRGTAGTDHLVAANLYSDTEVPFNLHGTGFYIHPTANSADLSFYNDEAHRGFYGFSFECGALPCTSSNSVLTATLVNVKAYFNRSYGLNDATYTGTAAHYSYAHFYGNQIKWPIVGDVNGGVAGTNVLSNLVDPAVKAWKLYTPRVALNFGDVGAQNGADTAFNNYAAALGSAPVSVGVATNFPVVPSLVTEIQGWVTAGYDISLLGLSDTSYQNLNVLSVQCASATSATLTISGTTLSTSVTGGSCTPVSYSLTSSSYLTIQQVEFALRAAGYTATLPQPCGACSWLNGSAMLSVDLAAVAAHSILTPYTLQFIPASFLNSELSGAQAWIGANLTGTSGKFVYWYPGLLFCNVATNCPSISPSNPEAYTVSNGYDMARGALSMQAGADGIQGGYDLVAAAGVDAHGMVACEMGGWNGLTPVQLAATIQVLAEKSAVWGVPYLCYFQPGSFSNVQLARAIADLGTSGITLMTDSALASFLEGKTNIPAGGTSYAWGPDGAAAAYDGSESYLSPTVGAGSTLASTYQLDVWGRLQAQFRAGWDMGATVLVPVYLGLRPGH